MFLTWGVGLSEETISIVCRVEVVTTTKSETKGLWLGLHVVVGPERWPWW